VTPQQIKEQFRARGESVGQWADANGFPRDIVYRVLNGRSPAWRGRTHQVAVGWGIKPNVNQPTK
jgi:gp16 family phage-associated protein